MLLVFMALCKLKHPYLEKACSSKAWQRNCILFFVVVTTCFPVKYCTSDHIFLISISLAQNLTVETAFHRAKAGGATTMRVAAELLFCLACRLTWGFSISHI